jgi:hypothetical protein
MSLVKSPEPTPEKLAANQANARQSQGPATPEGVERIRAANTRHGFYSKARGAEMHLLGEDKREFVRLDPAVILREISAWRATGSGRICSMIAGRGSPAGGKVFTQGVIHGKIK